jgi:holin-like protein
MRILIQATIISLIALAGAAISLYLVPAIPGSIVSMILTTVLLTTKVLKTSHISDVGDFLLKNMGLFFVPACVGLIERFDLLKGHLVPFLLICVASTIGAFASTAVTVRMIRFLKIGSPKGRMHE